MKQFTSHLDFSLTKKRLRMMGKTYSRVRKITLYSLLVPLIGVTGFTFCTQISTDKDVLYADQDLYNDIEKSEKLRRSSNTWYTKSGIPFTGISTFYRNYNDELYSKTYFVDGLPSEYIRMDNGIVTDSISYGYYLGEMYTKARFQLGIKLEEEIPPTVSDDGFGHIFKWHKNGTLKYESTYSNNYQYEGFMTLYNEVGEIVEQEIYENGNLVEKIKQLLSGLSTMMKNSRYNYTISINKKKNTIRKLL